MPPPVEAALPAPQSRTARSCLRRVVGNCRYAWQAFRGRSYARRHTHVAWAMAGSAVVGAWFDGSFGAAFPAFGFLFFALATLAIFDARALILPDAQVAILAAVGLISGLTGFGPDFLDQAVAGLAGFVTLQAVSRFYLRLRGQAGLGPGDAKLLAAGGLWIGLDGLLACLFLSAISAFGTVLVLSLQGRALTPKTAIPFGPHLALGIWLAKLLRPQLSLLFS